MFGDINIFLMRIDVRSMQGRCEVDVGSMQGRCEVDAGSMCGRCVVDTFGLAEISEYTGFFVI